MSQESKVRQTTSSPSGGDSSLGLPKPNENRSRVIELDEHRRTARDVAVIPEKGLYQRLLKRPFDIVAGTAMAVVFAPLTLLIALAVRVGLGRPIFYEQERLGESGKTFTIYKFRTMRPDRRQRETPVPASADRRTGHKSASDPRHTGLGRRLRKLSLDELPQFINVLRGEMSLVGPRPELLDVATERGYVNHVRHSVKPGMTGPYQTSDLRYNGDLRDGLHLDTEYVFNVSFRGDLRYLLRTVGVLFSRGSGS